MLSIFTGLTEVVRRADKPDRRVTLSDITIGKSFPISREYAWDYAEAWTNEDWMWDGEDEVYHSEEMEEAGRARMECFAWNIRYDGNVSEYQLGFCGEKPREISVDSLIIATVIHYRELRCVLEESKWKQTTDFYCVVLH